MIFHDLDVEIPDSKKTPKLSALSGANALVTPILVPPVSDMLVKKHVDAGACFLRIIPAEQLQATDSEVLYGTLNKLIGLGAGSWQMVLLIDSMSKLLDFDKFLNKILIWQEHGGTVLDTYGNPTALFISKYEKRYLARAKERQTFVHPLTAPRSQIVMITDYRITVATFPNIGYKGANVIQKQITEHNLGDDLLTALVYMTDSRKLKNKNKTLCEIVKGCREWMNLPDGFDLDIKFSGDEESKDGHAS